MPSVTVYLTKRSLAVRAGVSVRVVTRLERQGTIRPDAMLETGRSLVPVFLSWQAATVLRHANPPTRLA